MRPKKLSVGFWFQEGLVLSCTILCSTAFCRLSNDNQRRITQRIDVDGTAYRLHGQKLAGIAFDREWNNVGETASAAAAGNRFHSEMVRATNDPWSCAVTAPMARDLKLWFAFVRPSAATIPSSSADTAVLLWVTSKEPVCPRVELILKVIIILLIIFLGFIKSKPC